MAESIHEEGHALIVQKQEAAYVAATEAAAELDVWLQLQRGNLRKKFEVFLLSFSCLYRLTYCTNPVFDAEDSQKCLNRIRDWFSRSDVNADRVREGVELFDEYQRILYSSGLFNVMRQ